MFVEDSSDPVNADGVSGHLETVGDSEHKATFYEVVVKRFFDIVLSFGDDLLESGFDYP